MAFNAQLILAALDKHFAAVDARWDRFLAAQDQRWVKQVIPGELHYMAPIVTDEIRTGSGLTSTEPSVPAPTTTSSSSTAIPVVAAAAAPFVAPSEGAVVRCEELTSRVAPTAASMAEILDIEPIDEISSDGYLTPAVIAPTESVVVFPITGCVAPTPVSCLTPAVVTPTESVAIFPIVGCVAPVPVSCLTSDDPAVPVYNVPTSKHPPYATAVVQGTAEEIPTNPPSKCSTKCVQVHDSTCFSFPEATLFHSSSGHIRCSIVCHYGLSSMLTTTLSSSSPTWMFDEVIYNFGKRPWPPLAPVLSKQGMHKLVVGPLKPNVIWSKSPWPPPIQWLLHGAADQFRPIPWPSFSSWNTQCASVQHSKKNMDFVMWITGKTAWPFAELVCWNSSVGAAMTVITGAHMLRCLSAYCSVVPVIMISSELCLLNLFVANSKGILVDQEIIYLEYFSTDSAHGYWSASRWLESFQFLSSLHRPDSIFSADGIFRWPQTNIISISFWSSSAEITIPLTFIVGKTLKGHILPVVVPKWLFLSCWCEFYVATVSGQTIGSSYRLFLVHQLPSIVAVQQLFFWDPGGDHYMLAGLNDLQLQQTALCAVKKSEWLVLFEFLSRLHWPSYDFLYITLLILLPQQGPQSSGMVNTSNLVKLCKAVLYNQWYTYSGIFGIHFSQMVRGFQ